MIKPNHIGFLVVKLLMSEREQQIKETEMNSYVPAATQTVKSLLCGLKHKASKFNPELKRQLNSEGAVSCSDIRFLVSLSFIFLLGILETIK